VQAFRAKPVEASHYGIGGIEDAETNGTFQVVFEDRFIEFDVRRRATIGNLTLVDQRSIGLLEAGWIETIESKILLIGKASPPYRPLVTRRI
jgi:hypothetical protein